ncbi:restriction endonuclease [Dehalobacter sp. TBBPA1]
MYQKIGYDTKWTPPTCDGGKDIIVTIKRPDGMEYVYIECELYKCEL